MNKPPGEKKRTTFNAIIAAFYITTLSLYAEAVGFDLKCTTL